MSLYGMVDENFSYSIPSTPEQQLHLGLLCHLHCPETNYECYCDCNLRVHHRTICLGVAYSNQLLVDFYRQNSP